jgi:hypothetical protein
MNRKDYKVFFQGVQACDGLHTAAKRRSMPRRRANGMLLSKAVSHHPPIGGIER